MKIFGFLICVALGVTINWWFSKAIIWAVNQFVENDFPYDWQHTLAVFIGISLIGGWINQGKFKWEDFKFDKE